MPQDFDELPFQIDHIIARKHGGPTSEDNLALACFYCNTNKGPNVAGIDPEIGELVRLFNPRKDNWAHHFLLRFRTSSHFSIVVLHISRALVGERQFTRWIT
jgi:hypothetical protein